MSRTSIDPAGAPRRVSLNGPTMGSRWTAVWYDDGRPDPFEIGRRLVAAVGAVDDQMSTWKPDSALMRLDRAPVGRWQDVPASLATVLGTALDIGRASGGAFDVGVGRLVADWGFGAHARRTGASTGSGCGLSVDALEVDHLRHRVRKYAPTALDLSGIAKGFGVDELARVLDEAGMKAFLVGIDGEMRASGRKPEGSPWSIAIERPDAATRAVQGILHLKDTAVATSGDYRQFRDGPEGRISHTIDPRTGRPVRNGVASVTVTTPTAMIADALATALMVLGPADGVALATRWGAECLFILRQDDGSFLEVASAGFGGEREPLGERAA